MSQALVGLGSDPDKWPLHFARCWGWATVSCPNESAVYISWYYDGARAWPSWGYWCRECSDQVFAFLREKSPGAVKLREVWR